MLGDYEQIVGWTQASLPLRDDAYPCAGAVDARGHLAEAEELCACPVWGQDAYGIAGKTSQAGRNLLSLVFKFIDFRPKKASGKGSGKKQLGSNF